MKQAMDDPGYYKAYVWGDSIHTKTAQNNEQGRLKMICFAGTDLSHQTPNLKQIAHFPIMIMHANILIVFSGLHS